MKPIHFLYGTIVLALSLTACKKFDTLMPDPQVNEISFDQAELIKAFGGLTGNQSAACNIVTDPAEIPDILCRIMADAREGSEIVFLVDKTSSMEDDIEEVKRSINRIIDCLPPGCRLGAATYGDYFNDGNAWFDNIDLNEDYDVTRQYVNQISVVGGGDIPESVYDGIWEVLDRMSWKDCRSPDKIIVMGDAPPKTDSGTVHDIDEVLAKAKALCPDTEFYPVIVLDL